MVNNTPLSSWLFLVGKWKSIPTDQSDDSDEIVSTVSFSTELGSKYIMGKHDFYRDGKLEKASISVMFFDTGNERFLRKTFFSYGYVDNEDENERSDDEIHFSVISEPVPQSFDGLRVQSYIRKISDTEIVLGLETAEEGEDFQLHSETHLRKQT